MNQDLLDIRSQLSAALARLDHVLLAGTAPGIDADTLRWRRTPGGWLSRDGVVEINRRLAAGEPDAVIARGMGISIPGVQKRRNIYNARQSV